MDRSNGYEAVSKEFLAHRGSISTRSTAIGVKEVRKWARTLSHGSAFVPAARSDLHRVFSLQFERTVNRDNTVSFLNRKLQIEPVRWRGTLAGCTVIAHQHLNGTLSLSYGPHC